MMGTYDKTMAELIGRRVLEWKGSEFIEFVYLLEEKNALKILNLISSMADDDQELIIKFCERAHSHKNGLRIDDFCLRIEQE